MCHSFVLFFIETESCRVLYINVTTRLIETNNTSCFNMLAVSLEKSGIDLFEKIVVGIDEGGFETVKYGEPIHDEHGMSKQFRTCAFDGEAAYQGAIDIYTYQPMAIKRPTKNLFDFRNS